MRCLSLLSILLLIGPLSFSKEPTIQDKIIAAAEAYLGEPYVFGGRDGRPGCRQGRKRVRCPEGIDC